MHIAYNALLLASPMSGVEYAIFRLAYQLGRSRTSHRFACLVGRDCPAGLVESAQFYLVHLPVHNRHPLLRIVWEQVVLPKLLARHSFDLLHAPGYTAPLAAQLPSVVSIYDLFALTHPQLCKPSNVLHYRLVLPPTVRRAARLLVPSEFTRQALLRHLPVDPARVRVIPLGVGEEFRPVRAAARLMAVRNRYRLPASFVLTVSNLDPKKNLTGVLAAWEELKARGRPQHLVLTGGKGWREAPLLRQLSRSPWRDQVHLLGYVPTADLPAVYSLAEVFVFPSLVEGFGLPPLEAMACGTPVVASRRGALPEVLGDAAYLTTPDAQAVAAALLEVLDHPDLAMHLRQVGRQRALGFTWERTAQATLQVYGEAAG